jgi:hypothetical protein
MWMFLKEFIQILMDNVEKVCTDPAWILLIKILFRVFEFVHIPHEYCWKELKSFLGVGGVCESSSRILLEGYKALADVVECTLMLKLILFFN